MSAIRPLLFKPLFSFLIMVLSCFSDLIAGSWKGTDVFIYVNLINCSNCNLAVTYLESSTYFINNCEFRYLLEDKYKATGQVLISEYLSRSIDESKIFYSDSLVSLIKREFASSSVLLILKEDQHAIIEISDINYINGLLPVLLNQNISVHNILDEPALSDQLIIKIFDSDTFVIDRILSKIYKNGKELLPKLYVSDIPDLVNFQLSKRDSMSTSYRIEYENIEKINNTYVLFVSGNQLIRSAEKGTVGTPKSILLMFENSPDSLLNYKAYILSDPKKCYFDNYSILNFKSNIYLLHVCDLKNLRLGLSEIKMVGDELKIGKPNKLILPREIEPDANYYGEYGDDNMLFIGHKVMYKINNKWKIIPSFKFGDKVPHRDYIVGFSRHNVTDIKAVVITNDNYGLMNFPGYGSEDRILNEFVVRFDMTSIGPIQSNCIYQDSERSFLFMVAGGKMIKILSN